MVKQVGWVGTTAQVSMANGGWLLAVACSLLLGIAVLLAVLWFRARHRLHAVHADLQCLQQQVVGLSEQLRESEQRRQQEWQQLAEQRQWAEQQLLAGQRKLAKVSASAGESSVPSMSSVSSGLSAVPAPGSLPASVSSLSAASVPNPPAVSVAEPLSTADEQLLAQAKAYIETHLARPGLSVEEVSEALGMSRVYLYRKLLAMTGRTPIEYIRFLRMQRAAELLRTTSLPIGAVGKEVGIPNLKHFSRYFKEEYGQVPTAYQRTFSTLGCFTNKH